MNPPSPKISILAIVVLIFVALLCDLLSIIPGIGIIVGPIYWFAVAAYFYYKGFGLLNVRRLAPMLVSGIGELLPLIQVLPTMFVGTIILLILIKTQEKTGISLKDAAAGKFNARQVLNHNGIRQPNSPQSPSSTRNANIQPLVSDGVRKPSAPDLKEAA